MAGAVTYTSKVPVWVVFNTRNIGLTGSGDVTVTYTPSWSDQTAYQTGTYLLDSYFTGAQCTVSCIISETSPVNTVVDTSDDGYLGDAFPMGEAQNDAATERFSLTKIADVATNSQFIGQKASSIAAELILIPMADYADDDTTEVDLNFVVPKAFVKENGEMLYSMENNLEVPITFHALFTPGDSQGESLAYFGQSTGTWTAGGLA